MSEKFSIKEKLKDSLMIGVGLAWVISFGVYAHNANKIEKDFNSQSQIVQLDSTYNSRRDSLAKAYDIQLKSINNMYHVQINHIWDSYKKEHKLDSWSLNK